MLESIIFHFVFVLFILWAFIWWLITKKKLELLKHAIIPMLLQDKIEFPRDRSLVVRSVPYLQNALSEEFQCIVQVETKFSTLTFKLENNFLTPLCHLIWKNKLESNKYFVYNGNLCSSEELISTLKLEKVKKVLIFNYDFDKKIWNVEIQYA